MHNVSATPSFRNITISNVTVTAIGGNIAGIMGPAESLVSNVTIDAVNISAPSKTFCVYNATGIRIIDSNLTAPNTSTNTFTIYNAGITITNSAANAHLVTLGGLDFPPTNNVLAFFNAQATITTTNMLGPDPYLTMGGSTLTVNNSLKLGGTSTLNFGVGTNATEIAVVNNLTLGGGTLNITDGGGFGPGTNTLFTYGGTLSYQGLTIGSVPNSILTYTINTNSVGQVKLVVQGCTARPPSPPAPRRPVGARPVAGVAMPAAPT